MNSFQTSFYFNSSVDISWLPTFEQLRSFFIIVFSDAEMLKATDIANVLL